MIYVTDKSSTPMSLKYLHGENFTEQHMTHNTTFLNSLGHINTKFFTEN